MAFWTCCRLATHREGLALHCLALAGFTTYLPRLRELRVRRGRRLEARPPLFPGYCFVLIELQWHAARWAPGTLGLVMNNGLPVRVPDNVIAEIRSRECNGLIELPSKLKRGDRVRILRGPFEGQLAIYAEMKPRERIEVLMSLLGSSERRLTLRVGDVEAL